MSGCLFFSIFVLYKYTSPFFTRNKTEDKPVMKKCTILIFGAMLLSSCVSRTKYNTDIDDLEYRILDLEQQVSTLEDEKEVLEEEIEELDDIVERAAYELKSADYYFLIEEYHFAYLSVSDARRILRER